MKNKRGTTLAELVIVLAVLSIMMFMVLSFTVIVEKWVDLGTYRYNLVQDQRNINTMLRSFVNALDEHDFLFQQGDFGHSLTARRTYTVTIEPETPEPESPDGGEDPVDPEPPGSGTDPVDPEAPGGDAEAPEPVTEVRYEDFVFYYDGENNIIHCETPFKIYEYPLKTIDNIEFYVRPQDLTGTMLIRCMVYFTAPTTDTTANEVHGQYDIVIGTRAAGSHGTGGQP